MLYGSHWQSLAIKETTTCSSTIKPGKEQGSQRPSGWRSFCGLLWAFDEAPRWSLGLNPKNGLWRGDFLRSINPQTFASTRLAENMSPPQVLSSGPGRHSTEPMQLPGGDPARHALKQLMHFRPSVFLCMSRVLVQVHKIPGTSARTLTPENDIRENSI